MSKHQQKKQKPICHEDAQAGSPENESVAGEEDPGVALEELVKEKQIREDQKKGTN